MCAVMRALLRRVERVLCASETSQRDVLDGLQDPEVLEAKLFGPTYDVDNVQVISGVRYVQVEASELTDRLQLVRANLGKLAECMFPRNIHTHISIDVDERPQYIIPREATVYCMKIRHRWRTGDIYLFMGYEPSFLYPHRLAYICGIYHDGWQAACNSLRHLVWVCCIGEEFEWDMKEATRSHVLAKWPIHPSERQSIVNDTSYISDLDAVDIAIFNFFKGLQLPHRGVDSVGNEHALERRFLELVACLKQLYEFMQKYMRCEFEEATGKLTVHLRVRETAAFVVQPERTGGSEFEYTTWNMKNGVVWWQRKNCLWESVVVQLLDQIERKELCTFMYDVYFGPSRPVRPLPGHQDADEAEDEEAALPLDEDAGIPGPAADEIGRMPGKKRD